jgi:hypothetical protein
MLLVGRSNAACEGWLAIQMTRQFVVVLQSPMPHRVGAAFAEHVCEASSIHSQLDTLVTRTLVHDSSFRTRIWTNVWYSFVTSYILFFLYPCHTAIRNQRFRLYGSIPTLHRTCLRSDTRGSSINPVFCTPLTCNYVLLFSITSSGFGLGTWNSNTCRK